MSTIGELIVKVVYDTVDKASDALDKLGNKADRTKDKTKTLASAFKDFAGVGGPIGDIAGKVEDVGSRATSAASGFRTLSAALGGAVATAGVLTVALVAVAGAAGIIAAIRFASTLDDIQDLADKLGYSATQALLLKQQMDSAGTSIQTYVVGQQKIANALAKSDEEGKAAAEALKTLGINATATTSPVEVLGQITEEYKTKLADGKVSTEEMAALQLVLGKSYLEVMTAAEQAGIAQDRLNSFTIAGIGISKDGTKAAGDFEAAQNDLSFILQVVGSKLVGEVVPAFTALIEQLVESYKNGGLVKVAFETIGVAAQLVMVPIRAMIGAFMILDTAVTGIGKSIGALFAAIETRSMEPFKALKEDLRQLDVSLAERMKKVAVFGSDSGAIDTKTKATTVIADTSPDKTKPKKAPKEKEYKGNFASAAAEAEYNSYKTYATAIDQIVEDRETEQRNAALRARAQREKEEKDQLAATNKQTEALNRQVEQYRAFIDPNYIIIKQLEKINEMEQQGAISASEAAKGREMLQRQMITEQTTFMDGWAGAFKSFQEHAYTAANAGADAFSVATNAMEQGLLQFVTTGKLNFKSFAASILQQIAAIYARMVATKLIGMVAGAFGGAFGAGAGAGVNASAGTAVIPTNYAAKGDAFGSTGILMSAKGNVFNSPTLHGYSGGIGMLGEAGPEAILPLKRNGAGQLGVTMQGGGSSSSTQINNIVVNVEGGKTNEETGNVVSQQVLNIMKGIARQEISTAKRTGGMLNPV